MNYTLARLAPQTRRRWSAQAGERVARSSGWDQVGWTFRLWRPERRHSEPICLGFLGAWPFRYEGPH
jgi:hypothetical protein